MPTKRTNKKNRTAITRRGEWKPKFLKALAESGNVRIACEVAVVDRVTAYEHRKSDPEFAKGWSVALNESADVLEAEARRRACDGVDEPVIHQGQLMGVFVNADGQIVQADTPGATKIPLTVKKYSDTLLIFLLKGIRPNKFRDNAKVEHSGPKGAAIPVSFEKLTTDDLIALRDIRAKMNQPGNN